MTKQEILDRLNEIIKEELGKPVPIDGKFIDSELDSLGITLVLITIDSEFPILEGKEDFSALGEIPELTMRELVQKCRLSIMDSSTEPNSEKDT